MSENKQEQNNKEIIDSKVSKNEAIDESIDQVADKEVNINDENLADSSLEVEKQGQDLQPVIVKKGSFLSFLACVFALAALGISAYMYYLQYYKTNTNPVTKSWQEPIDVVAGKISQLKQQVTALQQDNQSLSKQLFALKNTTTEIQNNNNDTNDIDKTGTTVAYDDTAIQNQLAELQKQFNNNNQQQQQLIQDINKQLIAKQTARDNQPKISTTANMQTSGLAQSLLQAAYIQLNINGRQETAQELLGKAITQLQQLAKPEYANIITQLQQVIDAIGKVAIIDSNTIDQQIKDLSVASNDLTFPQLAATAQNTDAPWYEKLVVIKKVDNSEQKFHSKSTQLLIKNNIGAKFTLLQVALLTKNQGQWNTAIDEINLLLQQNFATDSQTIQTQLSELQKINLNPQYPDLQEYLTRLQAVEATMSSVNL